MLNKTKVTKKITFLRIEKDRDTEQKTMRSLSAQSVSLQTQQCASSVCLTKRFGVVVCRDYNG